MIKRLLYITVLIAWPAMGLAQGLAAPGWVSASGLARSGCLGPLPEAEAQVLNPALLGFSETIQGSVSAGRRYGLAALPVLSAAVVVPGFSGFVGGVAIVQQGKASQGWAETIGTATLAYRLAETSLAVQAVGWQGASSGASTAGWARRAVSLSIGGASKLIPRVLIHGAVFCLSQPSLRAGAGYGSGADQGSALTRLPATLRAGAAYEVSGQVQLQALLTKTTGLPATYAAAIAYQPDRHLVVEASAAPAQQQVGGGVRLFFAGLSVGYALGWQASLGTSQALTLSTWALPRLHGQVARRGQGI